MYVDDFAQRREYDHNEAQIDYSPYRQARYLGTDPKSTRERSTHSPGTNMDEIILRIAATYRFLNDLYKPPNPELVKYAKDI